MVVSWKILSISINDVLFIPTRHYTSSCKASSTLMASSLFLQGIKHPGSLHDVWARDTQEKKEVLSGCFCNCFCHPKMQMGGYGKIPSRQHKRCHPFMPLFQKRCRPFMLPWFKTAISILIGFVFAIFSITLQAEIESHLDGRVFNCTSIEGALDLRLYGDNQRTPPVLRLVRSTYRL